MPPKPVQRHLRWLAGLLAMALGAVGGAACAAETRLPRLWVSEPLPGTAPAVAGAPRLVLADATGRTLAESPDCRVLDAGDGVRLICGCIRPPDQGTFVLAARLAEGTDAPLVPLRSRLDIAGRLFDVVLVIDASYSMKANDPNALRYQAVRRFIDLARRSRAIRSVGLVCFRTDAEVILPPTAPAAVPPLDDLEERIRPHAQTDYNPAFAQAATLLAAGAAPHRVVVFLSDGQPRVPYRDGHRDLGARGWPVYAVGLSGEADAVLLSRIATESGGSYYDAPVAAELDGIFTRIFHLLAAPRPVYLRTLDVAGNAAETLRLDPTLFTPVFGLAPQRGELRAAVGALGTLTASPGDLASLDLAGTGPELTVRLEGQGRATCTLSADTDLVLETLAPRPQAPRTVPLEFHAFLAGGDEVVDAALVCAVRTADGQELPLVAERSPFGLWSVRAQAAVPAGVYRAEVTVRGTLDGAPFVRRTEIVLTRTEDQAQAAGASAEPVAASQAAAAVSTAEGVPVQPGPAPDATAIPGAELGTTFWVAPPRLAVAGLYPGATLRCQVEVMVQTAVPGEPLAELADLAGEGVQGSLEGNLQPNRRGTLAVVLSASPRSPGQSFAGRLRVTHAGRELPVPIEGRVETPQIIAALHDVTVARQGSLSLASGRLTVRLAPAGRCELRILADQPELGVTPADVPAGSDPVDVRLAAELPTPPSVQVWLSTLTVSGPGLAPVSVPFGVELGEAPAEEVAAPVRAPVAPRRGWPSLLLLALAALLALLLCLLGLRLRWGRRTVFALASAVIHIVVLALALPESRVQALLGSPGTPMIVASGPPLVEEMVAAETAAAPSAEGSPETAAAAKADAPAQEELAATPREVAAEAAATAIGAQASPAEMPLEAQRQQARPQELGASPSEPLARRQAAEPSEEARSQAAASAVKAQVDLPEQAGVAARALTPTPATAATAAGAEAVGTPGEIARGALAPTAVTGAPLRGPDRRRAAVVALGGAALPPSSSSPDAAIGGTPGAAGGGGTGEGRAVAPEALNGTPVTLPAGLAGEVVGPARDSLAPGDAAASAAGAPARRHAFAAGPAAGGGALPSAVAGPTVATAAAAGATGPARAALAPATVPGTAPGAAVSLAARARPAGPARETVTPTDLAGPVPSETSRRGRVALGGPADPGAPAQARERPAATLAAPPPSLDPSSRRLSVPESATPTTPTAGLLTADLGVRREAGYDGPGRGRWRTTFPNLQHSGDWDCDRTAMLNLASQVQRRTGSLLTFDSRTVSLAAAADLHQAPFLFMSGHAEFRFTEAEVARLAEYLNGGGYLWVNDSTDVGDETFDVAVRRELPRVLPGAELRPIPPDHPLFSAPYDLTHGYKGYPVPPGDKYRLGYLEGVWLGDRLVVVYTRNDYGDGLEIDRRTAPLMASLSDLSAAEMQEGSVRMGTNIAHYCMTDGRPGPATLAAAPEDAQPPAAVQARTRWAQRPSTALPWLAEPTSWQPQPPADASHVLATRVTAVAGRSGALAAEFDLGGGRFRSWWSKSVLSHACPLRLTRDHALLVDVTSHLPGGGRVALAFSGPQGYLETAPVFVRPGLNANLVFELGASTHKTAQSQWECSAPWPEGYAPDTFLLLTYPQQGGGRIEFANLRVAGP